jgi:predicted nucleotidyltransferase
MKRPATRDTAAHEVLIREASKALEADPRIRACWLEGSFATGTADPWSDVDLHVAVTESGWDDIIAERFALIGRIRPVLGFVEATMPWGVRLVSANVSGPVRLDLFIERQSHLESAPRREQPVVLFDKAGLSGKLRANWNTEALLRLQLTQLVQTFFFGSAWPVRLSGREEWGTLLMNALWIVYEFLVPAILIQEGSDNFFRPRYHNERHLSPERRRQVDLLVGEIRASFEGIATGRLNQARVAKVHEQLAGAIWLELRRACELHGVKYPSDAEREMQEYYLREMGWQIEA